MGAVLFHFGEQGLEDPAVAYGVVGKTAEGLPEAVSVFRARPLKKLRDFEVLGIKRNGLILELNAFFQKSNKPFFLFHIRMLTPVQGRSNS
jgi:hypothetical protein